MALQTFPSLSDKGRLLKSLSASFRFNRRNMENPWYGLWALELQKLVEPFSNLVIVPQYTLWYKMADEEPDEEPIEEIDEDAVSEIGFADDLDEGRHEPDNRDTGSDDELDLFRHKDESDDELDLLRDKDESNEPFEGQKPAALNTEVTEQDPDTSITESLMTVSDGSAPQLTPDFVALHILAKTLRYPTNNHLRRRYEQRAGYRIIHECCPLVVEIKPFPSRSVKPERFRKELLSRMAAAKKALGYQCYHLFKKYEHAFRTIVVMASGDYWTHLVVTRSDVPRGVGDEMNEKTWKSLKFPDVVILGTPASDLRMKEISEYLRVQKPDLNFN